MKGVTPTIVVCDELRALVIDVAAHTVDTRTHAAVPDAAQYEFGMAPNRQKLLSDQLGVPLALLSLPGRPGLPSGSSPGSLELCQGSYF